MTASDNARLHTYTIDTELQLKDAGLVAVSAAAQVGGSDKVIDLGDAYVEGKVLIEVTALEFATADEKYDILLQFAQEIGMDTTVISQGSLQLGDARFGANDQVFLGRYVLPFSNRSLSADGVLVDNRYMRIYTEVAGTVATGINFTAYIVKGN